MARDSYNAMSWHASTNARPHARTNNLSTRDSWNALSAVLDAATAPDAISALSAAGADSASARVP